MRQFPKTIIITELIKGVKHKATIMNPEILSKESSLPFITNRGQYKPKHAHFTRTLYFLIKDKNQQ